MKTLRVIYAVAIITIISVASDCHALYAYYKKRQEYALRQAHIVQVQQEQADRYAQVDALLEARKQRLQEREHEKQLSQQQLEQKLSEQYDKAQKQKLQQQARLEPSPDIEPVQLLQEIIFGKFCDFEILETNTDALPEKAVKCGDPTILEFLFEKTTPRYQNPIRNSIIRHAVNLTQDNVILWLLTKNCFYELWNEAITYHNSPVMSMLLENREHIDMHSIRFWGPVFKNNSLHAMNMIIEKIENNKLREIINTPDSICEFTLLDSYLLRIDQRPSMARLLIKAGARLSRNGEPFANFLLDVTRVDRARILIPRRKSVGLDDMVALSIACNLGLIKEVQDIVFDSPEHLSQQIHQRRIKDPLIVRALAVLSKYEEAQQVLLERELRGTMLDCEHHIDSRHNTPRCLLNYAKSLFFSWDLSTEENNKNTIQERSVLLPNTVLRIIYGYLGHSSEPAPEAPQID